MLPPASTLRLLSSLALVAASGCTSTVNDPSSEGGGPGSGSPAGGSSGTAGAGSCSSGDGAWTHPRGEAFEAEVERGVHLVGDSARCRFYVTTEDDDPVAPGSLVVLDEDGWIVSALDVGSEPGAMAIADDASTLWVALDGTSSVRRIDLTTDPPTVGPEHELPGAEQGWIGDPMVLLAGTDDTLVVSLHHPSTFPSFQTLAILDDGVPRPPEYVWGGSWLTAGPPGLVFANDLGTSDTGLFVFQIGATDLTETRFESVLEGADRMVHGDGRLFTQSGLVLDVSALDAPASVDERGPQADALLFHEGFVYGATGVGTIVLTRTDAASLDETDAVELETWGTKPLDLATTSGRTFGFLTPAVFLVNDPF